MSALVSAVSTASTMTSAPSTKASEVLGGDASRCEMRRSSAGPISASCRGERLGLGPADVAREEVLAVEVVLGDDVEVDERERAHAGAHEHHGDVAAQSAAAQYRDVTGGESRAHLGVGQVLARVSRAHPPATGGKMARRSPSCSAESSSACRLFTKTTRGWSGRPSVSMTCAIVVPSASSNVRARGAAQPVGLELRQRCEERDVDVHCGSP